MTRLVSATCWQIAVSEEGQDCSAWTSALCAHLILDKQEGIPALPQWYIRWNIVEVCALSTRGSGH